MTAGTYTKTLSYERSGVFAAEAAGLRWLADEGEVAEAFGRAMAVLLVHAVSHSASYGAAAERIAARHARR